MNVTNIPFCFKSVLKAGCSILLFNVFYVLIPSAAAQSSSIAYTWTTFAGLGSSGSADGVGSASQFNAPEGIVSDKAGNLFVVDSGNDTIRKITPAGVVSTIAGLAGAPGSADGMGSDARFNFATSVTLYVNPFEFYKVFSGIAMDSAGNLYVSDSGNGSIRKITPVGTNWVVSTIPNISLSYPSGIAVDGMGNIYVVDTQTYTNASGGLAIIKEIMPAISGGQTNWVVSNLASYGFEGLGGYGVSGIAVDRLGNVYVGVGGYSPPGGIYEVDTNVPGSGLSELANINVGRYCGLALDSAGNLYAAVSGNSTVLTFTPYVSGGQTNWTEDILAGSGTAGSANGAGTNAQFNVPQGITVDPHGNVYVADTGNNLIRKISPAGSVGTLAGALGTGSADGSGSNALFNHPIGMAADTRGNLYVADTGNNTIRTITPAGVVNTLAGLAGKAGSADGVGSNARFNRPEGVAVDNRGNVYVADTGNGLIREVTPAGVVSTLAGSSAHLFTNYFGGVEYGGFSDGTGTNALFSLPSSLALDSAGDIFVSDQGNGAIRKITPTISGGQTNWVVSTIVTNQHSPYLNWVVFLDIYAAQGTGIALDRSGNLRVLTTAPPVGDWGSPTIAIFGYTIATTTGMVITNLGLSETNYNPAPSTDRNFYHPAGVAVDSADNSYVADCYSSQIFKISPSEVASVIGGADGMSGSADGAGIDARFDIPSGIAVDSAGNVYVADTYNNTIRKGVFSAYEPAKPVAYSPPGMDASLTVNLLPPEAKGQWRFPWEASWHNSGDIVSNLVAGNYPIRFRSLSGYLTLSNNFDVAVTGGTTTYVTNFYYPTFSVAGTTNAGSLTVDIQPNAPSGSGWRFLGETGWRAPGSTALNLPPDVYFIEFEPVSGYSQPANQAIQVYPTLPTVYTANYLLAQSPPSGVLLPEPVPVTNINDMADYPFGFNGQLQTDVGYGSGVAVQQNVVLTAAHLVFNDQTLSYVSQAWWYFRQEAGVFQPKPLQARGWYVLSGYAAERTNDLLSGFYTPGQSSPQSRNFDVAALYFEEPVAGGAYGGYLPSDVSPNTWLTSTSLKMLVGYPVDGSLFGDASIVPGTLYQTDPQPYPLTLATDPVADQQVYLANWLLSYPGNSGGPLYVQYNGYYYPAGVYLGTLFSGTVPYASLVRAIDSNVVDMITLAQTLGDSGTNNTGGGVITIIPNQAISANNPGYIQFQLQPSAAVEAGAAWRLQGQPSYSTATNYTVAVTSTNAVVVQFKAIAGWNLPTNQTVTVLPGQLTAYSAFYMVTNPVLVAKATLGIGITGTTGTVYQIQTRGSLATGTWVPVSTNTILSNGFNLILPPSALPNQTSSFYRAVWLP